MTGPGENGVAPALTVMSFGAIWPAFAGAGDLFFLMFL